MRTVIFVLGLELVAGLVGCKKEEPAPTPPPTTSAKPAPAGPSATAKKPADHVAPPAAAAAPSKAGHGGPIVALGETKVDKFTVRASRDEGEIKPGGDAPVDVWINGGTGEGVLAVRFWIGLPDAKGSVKAKADVEDGKWHTHVELPSPLPEGGKLWVEIEESAGKKTVVSFDLRR